MKNIYRYLSVILLSVAGFTAAAQNLDPTVVVDRAYQGKLMEVHKPSLEMAVPDSVMRFDLDFDYSVFENPYKGSYEFNPYLLSMKPTASSDRPGRLYLRAGAGYQLYPELDFVYSPLSGPFRMDVYANNRSYVGNYTGGNNTWSGYDFGSKAGVALGYDWESSALGVDVGYYGMHQKDNRWTRGYNALDASFRVGSRNMMSTGFVYELRADYRLAADRTYVGENDRRGLRENVLDVALTLGKGLKKNSAFRADIGAYVAGYSGTYDELASNVYFTPRWFYRKGILTADLGVRLSKLVGMLTVEPAMDASGSIFDHCMKEQYIYPDVEVRANIFPKFMSLFLKVDGGNTIESYSRLLERNHFANVLYGSSMGVSVERVNLSAGLDGRIGSRFSYVLHGGYVNYAAGLLDAVSHVNEVTGIRYFPSYVYSPYQKSYASAEWLFKGERFTADGNVTYTHAWGDVFEFGSEAYCPVLKPAVLTGDVSFEYNFNRRIFAGVNCEFASARAVASGRYTVPAYADLGLTAEYVTSRNLSFWVKGGNLLGMIIEKSPLHAVDGPYFTLGICLNL